MNSQADNFTTNNWKVEHPHSSNNVVPMRSAGFTPYFCPGGSNAVPFYLGLSTGSMTSVQDHKGEYSATKKVIRQHLRK